MKSRILARSLTTAIIVLGAVATTGQFSHAEQRAPGEFFCGTNNGVPATLVHHPKRGELPFIRWVRSFAPDSRWTPEERCRQVSMKFQQNQKNGNLSYIVPGTSSKNGLPVLCASRSMTSEVISCPDPQILMTLRTTDDPQSVLKQLVGLNTAASSDPLNIATEIMTRSGSVVGIDVDIMIRNLPEGSDQGDSGSTSCTNLFGNCP